MRAPIEKDLHRGCSKVTPRSRSGRLQASRAYKPRARRFAFLNSARLAGFTGGILFLFIDEKWRVMEIRGGTRTKALISFPSFPPLRQRPCFVSARLLKAGYSCFRLRRRVV
ncbi:hypothetical protein MTO96_011592 [Rhipicephalus appendiculatus]